MNKKRGVLISTMDHNKTVTKSKSAHTNPLPLLPYNHSLLDHHNELASKSGAIEGLYNEQLAQSNLLSEEPERLVNQAYYTYQDPDSIPHHDSNRLQENEEYVIQSMQKRKEYLQMQRREEEKRNLIEKSKNNTLKAFQKAKPTSPNKVKSLAGNCFKRQNSRPKAQTQKMAKQKIKEEVAEPKRQKNEMNPVILKPRPLVFSVNMFEKGNLTPRSRQINDEAILRISEKISHGVKTTRVAQKQESYYEDNSGQNLNCKKLPFRFQGVL